MTSKPRFNTEGSLVPGLAAVALFVVLSVVFLTASMPAPAGFPDGAAITKSLGAAMFDIAPGAIMDEGEAAVPGEGFLVAFEIIDVLLVAALVGAVMLARREEAGEIVDLGTSDTSESEDAVAADGGERSDGPAPSSDSRTDGGTGSDGDGGEA